MMDRPHEPPNTARDDTRGQCVCVNGILCVINIENLTALAHMCGNLIYPLRDHGWQRERGQARLD